MCSCFQWDFRKPWFISIKLQFYFQLQKGNQKEKEKDVGGECMSGFFFSKHCDEEFRLFFLLLFFFLIKRKGPKKPVQAWGGFCITCSCAGFHVIAEHELFWVVVAFCLLFVSLVWFGFSLTSDYVFVIWGLRVGDVSRVSYLLSPGVCLYVCVLQGSVWQKVDLPVFVLAD